MPDAEATNAIIRELLAAPIGEFTAKRNARVKELRAAGDRERAAEIEKLRRPSLPLWAANQLARGHPELLARVREATTAATDAQARGSAAELRDALARLQTALDATAGAALEILSDAGHSPTADASLHLRELVRVAAVRGGDDWEALAEALLVHEPEPDLGFGTLPVAAPAPPPPVEAAPPQRDEEQDEERERLREERERALREARRQAADNARTARQALQRARRFREQADELAERAHAADSRAAEAERAAAEAEEQAAAARAAVEALEGELDSPWPRNGRDLLRGVSWNRSAGRNGVGQQQTRERPWHPPHRGPSSRCSRSSRARSHPTTSAGPSKSSGTASAQRPASSPARSR